MNIDRFRNSSNKIQGIGTGFKELTLSSTQDLHRGKTERRFGVEFAHPKIWRQSFIDFIKFIGKI